MDRVVFLKLMSMDLYVSVSSMSHLSGYDVQGFSEAETSSFFDSIHNRHLTVHPGFRRWELLFALEVLCSSPAVRSLKLLPASHITTRPTVDSPMVCGIDPQETVIVIGVFAAWGLRSIDVSLRSITRSIGWGLFQVT